MSRRYANFTVLPVDFVAGLTYVSNVSEKMNSYAVARAAGVSRSKEIERQYVDTQANMRKGMEPRSL